ncbi:MAG: DUF2190 family protein [Alphaproteobacteria bacterium]|nr:DUF2190 family protein [Alphaproteobacteria bacterium]MBF0392297.1 DUF2190 family protein [Alphaproteobacteria bacterium]
MQASSPVQVLTFTASGAILPARCVGLDGAQAAVQGQKVAGVSDAAAADGQAVPVVLSGTAIVEAGAAIVLGDSLIADAQGRAVPASGPLAISAGAVAMTSGAANGLVIEGADAPEFVFADAMAPAAGAGALIEVLLRR